MPEPVELMEQLIASLTNMFGEPSGGRQYLLWWKKPNFEIALEPRGERHINMWIERRWWDAVENRYLLESAYVPYDAMRTRLSTLENCKRLREGNAVCRIKCKLGNWHEVMDVVAACAQLANRVGGRSEK